MGMRLGRQGSPRGWLEGRGLGLAGSFVLVLGSSCSSDSPGLSRRLKNELLEIRRKGAKRSSQRYSERTCARCQQSLGRISPKANTCRGCNHLVCRECRSYGPNSSWRCKVCTKEA